LRATQAEQTYSFAPVTARYFRVVFKPGPPPPIVPDWGFKTSTPAVWVSQCPEPDPNLDIAELVLHPGRARDRWQGEGRICARSRLSGFVTPEDDADAIRQGDVIDLTSKMKGSTETLDWTPPAGTWTVLRHWLLAARHHQSSSDGRSHGLEVDKLDRVAVKDYFEKYLDSYKETVGP